LRRLILNKDENRPATVEDIRAIRDELEQAPVNIDGNVFDISVVIFTRMDMALAHWNSLPTLVDGKLPWRMHNDTIVLFDQAVFDSTVAQLKGHVAIRGALLHVASMPLEFDGTKTKGEVRAILSAVQP
jgi:hypothetical protein